MKLKNITFSKTGSLMIGNKNIRNWEELLKLTNYKKVDTLKKKLIGKVEMIILKYNTRTETLLIGSQDFVGNKKKSDYQIKAFENNDEKIKTRNKKNIDYITNDIFYKNIKRINETLEYLSDGTITSYDFMIVNLETGEVILEEEEIRNILLRGNVDALIEHLFPNKNNISNTPQTELLISLISNTKVVKKQYQYDIIHTLDLKNIFNPTNQQIFNESNGVKITLEMIKEIKKELKQRGETLNNDYDIASNLTHYNDAYYEKSFYLTENDISDLDIFFMHDIGSSQAKIIREPFFNFNVSSFIKTKPIFQLGSKHMVTVNSGIGIIAGRIVINAFHNIPLINTLIATKTISGQIQDIPPIDLYVINKKSPTFNRAFQDLVIKNVKFTSFNFEQGLDPGRYFVLEYFATDMQGIHLKDYIREQVYSSNLSEINIADEIYSQKLSDYNDVLEQLEKDKTDKKEENLNNKFKLFLSTINKWCSYELSINGSDQTTTIEPKNKKTVEMINDLPLDQKLIHHFKSLKEVEDLFKEITNDEYYSKTIYEENLVNFYSPIFTDLSADEVWKQAEPQLKKIRIKMNNVLKMYCYYTNQDLPIVKPDEEILDSDQKEEIENYGKYINPKELSLSNQGMNLIKKHEGFREDAYPDAGKWSIGYGSQLYIDGSEVKKGDKITRAEAEIVLKYDIENRRISNIRNDIKVNLSQQKFDSLVSLVYNIGSLSKAPKLRDKINQKKFTDAANEFDDIIKSQGVILDSLIKRRADEKKLFLSV